MDNTTVKIDKDLLERVDKVLRDKIGHIKYTSKKQFINIAVLSLLEQEEGGK